MPNPNLFALVENDQALTSYGPEFIDRTNPPIDLAARIAEIQNYLRKIKSIEKDFPADLDLDKVIDDINDPMIETYNQWLNKSDSIRFKDDLKINNTNFFNDTTVQNDMTFRKAYIQLLKNNFEQLKNKSNDIKEIKLEKFLDLSHKINVNGHLYTGYEIYQKALQEEMNSTQFKRAVLYGSLKIYKTDSPIDDKPVFCLLGPSGSGKSFSRDAFFKKEFPQGDKNQLMIFSSDNAIPRSQSKMLALTKQIIETSGHLVLDLDKSSKDYYIDFKGHIKDLGLKIESGDKNTQFGLFIPETFANKYWDLSFFNYKKPDNGYKFLNLLGIQPRDLKKIKLYAGKITHEDADIFPHIVKILAEQRAHPDLESIAAAKNNPKPFTFYPAELKEYKKYLSWNLAYSLANFNVSFVGGMESANRIIDAWKEANFKMKFVTVTNDLILVREDGATNKWRKCSPKEVVDFSKKHRTQPNQNYLVISHAVFKQWQALDPKPDLREYVKEHKMPPEVKFEDPKQLEKGSANALALNKIQRHIQEPITRECIQNMSIEGLLELARLCLNDPDFQNKFPKFYAVVLKNESIISKHPPASLDDDEHYQRVLTYVTSTLRDG
jgi:hypothetical protein